MHMFACEPIGTTRLAVPTVGTFGIFLLPAGAAPLLEPMVDLQNRAPEAVKFNIELKVVEHGGSGGPRGLWLDLRFPHGLLRVHLPAPFERWAGLLCSREVLLSTNPSLRQVLDAPAWAKVDLNDRTAELVDTATFPIKHALDRFLPRWVASLRKRPETICGDLAVAFEKHLPGRR